MAITVVEETRRIRCVKCTALNEYGNDDIGYKLADNPTNGSIDSAYVKCGRCDYDNRIDRGQFVCFDENGEEDFSDAPF